MILNNGEGAKLLLEEIKKTIDEANQDDELKDWASCLNNQLDQTQEILFHLMPFAMKGDYERFLADASVFMEFFSLVLVGWSWLEIGVATKHALTINNNSLDSTFYQSKLDALEYFYVYELPKTKGLAEILLHPSSVTIKKKDKVIN